MLERLYTVNFAAYGGCAYGENAFQSNDCSSSATASNSSTGAPGTGYPEANSSVIGGANLGLLIAATAVCVVAFGVMMVRIVRRPAPVRVKSTDKN